MPNMHDCLARGMDFGEIDKQRGIAAQTEFRQLYDRYAQIMPQGQAAARAAADLKTATAKAKTSRYHKTVNQLQAMRRIHDLITTAPDPGAALRNLLEFSEGSGFKGESVRSLTEAYEASINASLKDTLDAVGLDLLGQSRNQPLLNDLIRELHDEATTNPLAQQLAKGVRKVQQRMRRAFNSFGGDIGNLADYGVPHTHDAGQLVQAGFAKWSDTIRPLLAWDRITDVKTGQPFAAKGQVPTPADTLRFLTDVYQGITKGGWDDLQPSLTMTGTALYNQRAEHRVLHFASGTSWLEYNRQFGTSDPFSAMIGGLHGLARDVGMMRVLGPSPRAGLEFASQVATQRAMLHGDARMQNRVRAQGDLARAMLAHQDGSANRASHVAWARFFGGTRAVLTSIQLGSAVVSSVSDVATITAAAHTMGMSAGNVLAKSVDLTASHATRETAARMGYVAETLADVGRSMSRFQGQVFGTGIPEKLSAFTLRATGLAHVTDMRKIAFQMELSGHMAEMAHLPLDKVDKPLQTALRNRGITPADWDLLRHPSTHFTAPNGANFITPFHWLETQTAMPRVQAEGLAMRLQMMVQEQLEYAIPTASLEGRAMLQGTAPPGTIAGELMRSVFAYKSFSMSMMLGQYRRFMAAEQYGMNRWAYAAKTSAMLLVMGALAIQLKELVKGNDPRPMNTGKFWMASLFQGGGLGIFGDFFQAESSRVGGGLGETIAGPVVGLMGDVIKPIAANISSVVAGDNTHFGRDAANLLAKNTPFMSSAWYARLAYSRLVSDNLQAFLDPEAELTFRRRLKQQQKDYGTDAWWKQGDAGPARGPNIGNALGQ